MSNQEKPNPENIFEGWEIHKPPTPEALEQWRAFLRGDSKKPETDQV